MCIHSTSRHLLPPAVAVQARTAGRPRHAPHQLLGVSALSGFPGEALAEAQADGGDDQHAQVRGHQADGTGDVMQVQPEGQESGSGKSPKGHGRSPQRL